MKKIIKITALVLALVLCTLALVSCSTFGSIKSNFEGAGYTLITADKDTTGEIKLENGTITYTIHTFTKKSENAENDNLLGDIIDGITEAASTAIVWECASEGDLEKAIEANADIKAILDGAQKSDFVNGNCILMTLNPSAVKVFKGEK